MTAEICLNRVEIVWQGVVGSPATGQMTSAILSDPSQTARVANRTLL